MFKGVLLGFACYACFSFSDAFVKALRGSLPPYESVFFGALLMLAAIPLLKKPGDRWRDVVVPRHVRFWALRAIAGAICNLAAVTAFSSLPMAEVFSLIFLMPIFLTLLSVVFLKEYVSRRRWVAVIVGFAGVMVVLRPGFRQLSQAHIAALVCGAAGAVSVLGFRLGGAGERNLSVYGSSVIGPLVLGGALMLPKFIWPTLAQWLMLFGYGGFAGLAVVLLMWATRNAPVSAIAPTQYSQMFWAILLGYFLFQDRLDWPMAIGIALILGAGLFTLLREPPAVA